MVERNQKTRRKE